MRTGAGNQLKFLLRATPWSRVKVPLALEEGRRELQVNALVSPLRFDVLTRKSFFEFINIYQRLYRQDKAKFMDLALEHEYYIWFVKVYCPKYNRWALYSRRKLQKAYERKVDRTFRLYESFCEKGFVKDTPIILKTGNKIIETHSGKTISQEIYPGDGCHRLALLMFAGIEVLQPEWYSVERFKRYCPPDHTFQLLFHVPMDEKQYAEFISMRFGQRCNTIDALINWVGDHRPDLLPEVKSLIDTDRSTGFLIA